LSLVHRLAGISVIPLTNRTRGLGVKRESGDFRNTTESLSLLRSFRTSITQLSLSGEKAREVSWSATPSEITVDSCAMLDGQHRGAQITAALANTV
jgi:hypothetical protein